MIYLDGHRYVGTWVRDRPQRGKSEQSCMFAGGVYEGEVEAGKKGDMLLCNYLIAVFRTARERHFTM